MNKYSYIATDVSGRSIRGSEMAEDYRDLQAKLKARNLFVTSYKDLGEGVADVKYKFKTHEVSFISRQLASMTSAGLSLVRALFILQDQQENKKAKAVLLDIYEEVQKGRSFSDVLRSKPGVFPDMFVSLVAAGEASGTLDAMFNRLSDHYANANKTANKIKSAMVYPIILAVLVIAVMILLFVKVLPTFIDIMPADDLSAISKALIAFSDSLINYWYVYIIVIVGIIIAFSILNRTPSTKYKLDEFKLKIPKVGKLISTMYTGSFARNMANLYGAGLQMVECIEKSVAVINNTYVHERFKDVINDIKLGESMSKAIEKTGIFEGMFTSIIYVGEESGTLDTILEKSADYYDDEADAAVTKLVGMMEPLMIIIMGIAIGFFLAGVFPMLYGGMENIDQMEAQD
ncbi:MAG: type II secretion system F family protein [Oscillospiraceae bacterium]|nr:type II secretion system F family protein [Oscillospiraceae bacterium]